MDYVKIFLNIKNKGAIGMETYKLTAFKPDGEKLLDESFQAGSEEEAKTIGEKMLSEKNLQNNTYRCTSPKGKLVLFHP